MKSIIICFFFLIIIVGCKKTDKHDTIPEKEVYKIENGVVVFKSLQDYSKFLDNSTQTELDEFIAYTKTVKNYHPIAEKKTSTSIGANRLVMGSNAEANEAIADLLTDDFLSALINADGLVQIGQYLFNIDVENEKCYALHTSYLSGSNSSYYYNLLFSGNSNNNYVIEFSTDDDVIEFLTTENFPTNKTTFGGGNPTVAKLCGEGGAKLNKAKGAWEFKIASSPAAVITMQCKVRYQKVGIYFALFAKVQDFNDPLDGFISPATFIREKYSWRFKPKCWQERRQPYTINTPAVRKRYAWQSTRSLTKYEIGFQWEVNAYGGIQVDNTDVLYIMDGY